MSAADERPGTPNSRPDWKGTYHGRGGLSGCFRGVERGHFGVRALARPRLVEWIDHHLDCPAAELIIGEAHPAFCSSGSLSAETHAYGISEISASFITAGSGAAVSEVFFHGLPDCHPLLRAQPSPDQAWRTVHRAVILPSAAQTLESAARTISFGIGRNASVVSPIPANP